MNKKFLSAILFGALMVTSTGTFVSCKDYDDDIDRLDQEISNVKDAIKALEDKVGSGKYVESCTPFTDGNGGMKSNSVMERPLNYTMVQKENKVNRANQVLRVLQVLLLMIM